jgi:hypothetical protein
MSNTYKLRGKVAAITEPRTFPSGYTLQELIVLDESNPQYPQKIAVGFGGDRIAQLASLQLGQEVEVAFGIRSSEANGKHYTNLRGWGVSTITAAPVQTVAPIGDAIGGASSPGEPPPAPPPTTTGNPALEDLPF